MGDNKSNTYQTSASDNEAPRFTTEEYSQLKSLLHNGTVSPFCASANKSSPSTTSWILDSGVTDHVAPPSMLNTLKVAPLFSPHSVYIQVLPDGMVIELIMSKFQTLWANMLEPLCY
ncbi:hypothetical protein PRUPE_1G054500 [Prunus persica]|uniref:Uncharacterized protein n=1 Tax=Prunus persica TaxID=3760 RepID=A0A251QSU1_PRUPE|nr:hypothetical protein PRUPE_1G054500 [Prunus persica]